MSDIGDIGVLKDAELLAMIDNRFDIITEDVCRGGYGLSWQKEQGRPTLDMFQALREMNTLAMMLQVRWAKELRVND